MRTGSLLCMVLATLLCTGAPAGAETVDWKPYPETLPAFDFSGERLREHWPGLTPGIDVPFPDAEAMREEAARYPVLFEQTDTLLRELAREDPEFAAFAEASPEEIVERYAERLQRVWQLLFEGRLDEARNRGLELGPGGYFPGLYAQALYAVYIEPDPDERQTLLEQVVAITEKLLPHAPDHSFLRFGNAYAKARIMERLSRTEALRTGYTREVKSRLETLIEDEPDNIHAHSLLGGVHAGIIEKGGALLARTAFGASSDRMEEYFLKALELADDQPGVYLEYARARLRVHGDDDPRARELLDQAVAQQPVQAEQALQIRKAKKLRAELGE